MHNYIEARQDSWLSCQWKYELGPVINFVISASLSLDAMQNLFFFKNKQKNKQTKHTLKTEIVIYYSIQKYDIIMKIYDCFCCQILMFNSSWDFISNFSFFVLTWHDFYATRTKELRDRIRISRNSSSCNNIEFVSSFYSKKLLKFVWNLNLRWLVMVKHSHLWHSITPYLERWGITFNTDV